MIKKYQTKIIILCLMGLTFLPRLYRISYPLADWHAFRQADTASVTREYFQADKIDLLRPQYHDLSNIQSGQPNLAGYRMVEFPLINAFLAFLLKLWPSWDLIITSRLLAIFASLGTTWLIYRLGKKWFHPTIGLLSALFFALLPFSIFYTRTILPEPYVIFFFTLAVWQFQLYLINKKISYYIGSAISLALSALLKPYVIFFAPLFLMLLYQEKKLQFWREPLIWLYPFLAFLPLGLWRFWIEQFPSGIPDSAWLFNSNGIRWRPAWWRWLFYERLTKLISGYLGLILVGSIFLPWQKNIKQKKALSLLLSWWGGALLYFSIIATGNVQHDYYQVLILPLIALTLGYGTYQLYHFLNSYLKQFYSLVIIAFIVGTSWFFSWKQIKGFFQINHWEYVHAGQIADALLPPQALIIAPAMGDTHFLFQTKRRGWPIGFEIEDKISQGAQYYLSTSQDEETQTLQQKYQTIWQDETLTLIDLQHLILPEATASQGENK